MLLSVLASAALQQANPARAVLDATLGAYAACQTYKDTGEVVSAFEAGGEPADSSTRSIKTWFVRPGNIRFECHETDPESKADEYFVVWKGKTGSHTWWSRLANGTHEPTALKALRAASATSGGASDLLYPLMCPPDDPDMWTLAKLDKPVLAGQSTLDGAPCHVLKGTGFEGSSITVWIDEKTHAIRRFREAIALEGGRLTDTISLKPAFGAPVSQEDAWFKPPIVRDPPPPVGSTGGRVSR